MHHKVKISASRIPPALLGRALRLWFAKRVIFPRDVIGDVLQEEEKYTIFRKVIVLDRKHQVKTPGALFKVIFRFKRFSFAANRRLSLLPLPFIISQPGFISKTWLIGRETGCFQGLYEWESLRAAEDYADSFPLGLMKKRARPDSLHIRITALE